MAAPGAANALAGMGAPPSAPSPASEPLIGIAGAQYIASVFSKCASPAQAIEIIHAHAGLRNPLCQPVLTLLEYLGVSRREAHLYVLGRAKDMVLEWLRHLQEAKQERARRSSESMSHGSNADQLERLLVASFDYLSIPELAAVPLEVMKTMDQVPVAQLKKLVEMGDFQQLPDKIKQQVWEHDRNTLGKHALALVAMYKYEVSTVMELLNMNECIVRRPPLQRPGDTGNAAPEGGSSRSTAGGSAGAGGAMLPPLPRNRSQGHLQLKIAVPVLKVSALLPGAQQAGQDTKATAGTSHTRSPYRTTPNRRSPLRGPMLPPTLGRSQRRKASKTLKELAKMAEGSPKIFRGIKEMLHDKVRQTDVAYYGPKELSLCAVDSQLTMYLHDSPQQFSLVESQDPVHKLTWLMDAAIKRHRVDLQTAVELQAWLAPYLSRAQGRERQQQASAGGPASKQRGVKRPRRAGGEESSSSDDWEAPGQGGGSAGEGVQEPQRKQRALTPQVAPGAVTLKLQQQQAGPVKLRLKALKGAAAAAAQPASGAAAAGAGRRNLNAALADSDDSDTGGGPGQPKQHRPQQPALAAGGSSTTGPAAAGTHYHHHHQQEVVFVGPADEVLAHAALVLRDPPAMHLLAMEVVELLQLCIQEQVLPCQVPMFKLYLQLMHLGVAAHRLWKGGAQLPVPAPARLHDLWPFLVQLLVEGALLAPEEAGNAGWGWRVAQEQADGWALLTRSVRSNEVTRKVLQMLVLERLHKEQLAVAALLLQALLQGLDLGKWPAAKPEYVPFAYSLAGQLEELVKAGKVQPGDRLWQLAVERVLLVVVDADTSVHSETLRLLVAAAKHLEPITLGHYMDLMLQGIQRHKGKAAAARKRFGELLVQAINTGYGDTLTPEYDTHGQTDWSDGFVHIRNRKYEGGTVDSLSHLYEQLVAVGGLDSSQVPPLVRDFLAGRLEEHQEDEEEQQLSGDMEQTSS